MSVMKKVIMLIGCLMMVIAASAQVNVVDSVEEWIPDSIPIESVKDDFDLEIKEVELTDRYGVSVQDGKYGIRDFEKQENVTEIMYDEAYPSYRKKVMDEYITYFYIRVGNQSGVVGITESSNETMTIMAPPQK